MNVKLDIISNYEEYRCKYVMKKTNPIQTQFNPKQTQFNPISKPNKPNLQSV
jgi:hypothetical protein